MQYNPSAIGEMNFDELEQLKLKNAKRIKQIIDERDLKQK